jgi:hypothetical protein
MRIIITENQLKTILLTETKTIVVPDNQLDRAKSLVDKLKGKGFTLSQSAAMVGNMWIESGFDPDSESSNGAIGLMQWLGNRKSALKKYAEHKGTDWTSENTQLNFIKVELKDGYELSDGQVIAKGGDYEVNQFDNAMKGDTIHKKAENFATMVERCGTCDGTLSNRKQSAKKIYDYINGDYKKTDKTTTTTTDKKESGKYSVGSTIYPKVSEGYVNVRKEASRNSDRIVKIESPNKIGKITKITTDSNGYDWYKVTLDKSVDGYTSGWIRSDAVK